MEREKIELTVEEERWFDQNVERSLGLPADDYEIPADMLVSLKDKGLIFIIPRKDAEAVICYSFKGYALMVGKMNKRLDELEGKNGTSE